MAPRNLKNRLDKELINLFKDDPVLGARKCPIKYPDAVERNMKPPFVFVRYAGIQDRSLTYTAEFYSARSTDPDPDKYTLEYIEKFLNLIFYQDFGGYIDRVGVIERAKLTSDGPEYDGFVVIVVDSQRLY